MYDCTYVGRIRNKLLCCYWRWPQQTKPNMGFFNSNYNYCFSFSGMSVLYSLRGIYRRKICVCVCVLGLFVFFFFSLTCYSHRRHRCFYLSAREPLPPGSSERNKFLWQSGFTKTIGNDVFTIPWQKRSACASFKLSSTSITGAWSVAEEKNQERL